MAVLDLKFRRLTDRLGLSVEDIEDIFHRYGDIRTIKSWRKGSALAPKKVMDKLKAAVQMMEAEQ